MKPVKVSFIGNAANEWERLNKVVAEDQQALDGYRAHPDHKIIAKDVEEIEEDGIGFDFKSD